MTALTGPGVLAASARKGLLALLALGAVCGFYTSFRYHFADWGLDPDSLQDGILWLGQRAHGWAFLRTHDYSPDNWLFSLILPSIPLFDLIGPSPMVVVGIGWMSFLVTVAAAGIAAGILGGTVIALAAVACLLLSNIETLGPYGFLSHPASHDLSLSWGLLAILLFQAWLWRGRTAALGAGTIVLAADCLSDPWAVIGIALPCLAASLACMIRPELRARSVACAAAVAVALLVAKTKVFGVFSFLLSSPTGFGDRATIAAHAGWLLRSVGVMFDPLPGAGAPGPLRNVVTCTCVALALAWGSWRLVRAHRAGGARLWLALTLVLSAPLPSLAFTVSDLPASFMVGRFAVSLVVLFPVIVLAALGTANAKPPRLARIGVPALLALTAAASVASGAPVWSAPWHGMQTDGVPELTHFLRAHDLRFGYGEYWGSKANAVTFWSRGDVIIRPVGFDPQDGHIYRRGGSPLWFKRTNIPSRGGQYFVAFTDDGENCPSMPVCEHGVQQQFGPSDARYTYGRLVILAWNKPILLR